MMRVLSIWIVFAFLSALWYGIGYGDGVSHQRNAYQQHGVEGP